MSTIRNLIFLTSSLFLLGGGIYVGWQANTLYSQVVQITENPLGFAIDKMGAK